MGEILVVYVLYSICACGVLVWSTLLDGGRVLGPRMPQDGLEYVAIQEDSFFEPTEQHPSLVIFDMHAAHEASGWGEFISYWLPISAVDLPSVLRWLPPASRVGFCCKNATAQLDTHTKTILLQLGIGTVYFLSGSAVLQGNRWCGPDPHGTGCQSRTTEKNDDSNEAPLMKGAAHEAQARTSSCTTIWASEGEEGPQKLMKAAI
jgi:hypothetical protein